MLLSGAGICKGTAFLSARLGAKLVICGRKVATLESTADWLRRLGSPEIAVHPLGIREPEAVRAMMETLWERFGGLDVLVNNAGRQSQKAALRTRRDAGQHRQHCRRPSIDALSVLLGRGSKPAFEGAPETRAVVII